MEKEFIDYKWIGSSERLKYREFHPSDAEEMYNLNADPDVIKYTGDVAFSSISEAKTFLENYDPYSVTGFGRWCVVSKHSGKVLGWCGLKKLPSGDVDLGYRFFKKFWRRGYATESSKFSIEIASSKFKLTKLIGRVIPANTGSVKVLEKVGMNFSHMIQEQGIDTAVYTLSLVKE